MAEKRADYSELVEALLEGDTATAGELLKEVMPRLVDYLLVVAGADETVAEDCVQQAFLDVYEKITQNLIKEPKFIFSYLLKACRNEYFKFTKRENFLRYEEDGVDRLMVSGEQIENLLDEERQLILEECLEELQYDHRIFIEFFLGRPDVSTEEAEKEFGISYANVRTKKSRILNRLHHCYKRKSER